MASGAVGESREERSQMQNKKIAFERLANSKIFRLWLKHKAWEIMGVMKSRAEIEKEVDEMIQKDLKDGNIVIEEIKKR